MIATLKRLAAPLVGAAALVLAGSGAAAPRTSVEPYLEAQQVLLADLNGGEAVTYTALAAGVDASAATPTLEGQISYRYERRIAWDDDLADSDIHSGLAAVRYQAVPGVLALEAGALATRARADGAGPLFGFNTVDSPNLVEVYSLYGGPSLTTKVGDADLLASYRLGYVNVDDKSFAGVPLIPGQIVPDRYQSAVNHSAAASIGMAPGVLPVGWTLAGAYVREDVNLLDQRFEGAFVRGDVVVPVSSELALTAGVGYENIQQSQRDILRSAGGVPILTGGGRLIADRTRPRLEAVGIDGLIWDAGVIYRPDRRTELQARVGRRYGGTTVTGSFRRQLGPETNVSAIVYDSVDSFGRVIVSDLADVPTSFQVRRNALNPGVGGIGGCIFSAEGGSSVCFDDALQAVTTANFRNRGAGITFTTAQGPWSFNLGAGYANRKYLVPAGFSLRGVTDESFTVQAGADRRLSRVSGLAFDGYLGWYNSGVPGVASSFGAGVSGSYNRSLAERLDFQAALGLYTTDTGAIDQTVAQALVGLRYGF